MNGLYQNPLLQRDTIHNLVSEIPEGALELAGAAILPFTTVDDDTIKVDRQRPACGMTRAVADGAASPLTSQRGVQQDTMSPLRFREKIVLGPQDLRSIRKLGTAAEKQAATDIMAGILRDLRGRAERRAEWCRWQAMCQNSITVADNGINVTVTYQMPTYMRPTVTGVNRWSQATAVPVTNLLAWRELFYGSGISAGTLWMNSTIQRYLFTNTQVGTMVAMVFAGGNPGLMNPDVLNKVLKTYLGDWEIKIYDDGILMEAKCTAVAAAAGLTLVVDDASFITNGMTLTLVSADGSRQEQVTVNGAPVGNTVTLAAGPVAAYAIGDMVRAFIKFLPDDMVVIEGRLPVGALGGQRIGELVSTPSEYNPGTIEDPKPGFFAEPQIYGDNNDPKRVELIGGFYGLPVLYYKNGLIAATVA